MTLLIRMTMLMRTGFEQMCFAVKTCSKCKRGYPANTEHFYNQQSTSDKLTSWCKTCDCEASREKKRIRRQLGLEKKPSAEKMREYTRKHRANNIEKVRQSARHTQAKRRENGSYRAAAAMGRRIREVISRGFNGAFRHLPYTPSQLKLHLEAQFDSKMTWENYGSYWHIDHIRPVSLFHFEGPNCAGFVECWALTNLRPLEAKANLSKGNKVHFLI